MASVEPGTHETLAGLSAGDLDLVSDALTLREEAREATGLDARTYGLVKIAALIALDAPPASYMWQVANALDGGATPEDILGVLKAVAPQVGGPRVVAAAPELMVALGLSLPEEAVEQLKSLAQLHDKGILTDQEFNEQKALVLRG
jgi:4-carboxymuconolactone decarboxylase